MLFILRICLPMLITASPVLADDWFVSKFGKDDTLGAINHIDTAKTKSAAALVKQGKTVSLGMVSSATVTLCSLAPADLGALSALTNTPVSSCRKGR